MNRAPPTTGRVNLLLLTVIGVLGVVLGLVFLTDRERHLVWEEEAKVAGHGDVLALREARLKPNRPLGGPGGWHDLGASFQLLDPATKKPLSPKLEFFGDALLIEKNPASNRIELFAVLLSCRAWWRNGTPELAYARWELGESGWHQLAVTPEQIGKKGNLLSVYPVDAMPQRVTPENRPALNGDSCQRMKQACEITDYRITKRFCTVPE